MKSRASHFWLMVLTLLAATPAFAEAAPTRIGVLSFRALAQTQAQWDPTAAYLERALPGRQFRIVPLTYPELDKAVAERQVDFVLTNPEHYVLLRAQFGLAALATLMPVVEGHPVTQFGGVIFARADRADINAAADLRGKRIASPDGKSLGGYLMQRWTLEKLGVDIVRDAVTIRFTGMPHDNVVGEVMAGKADVGFVRTGVLEAMAREGRISLDRIKVINRRPEGGYPQLLSTDLYPEWPFAAMREVPDALRKSVTLALLELTPDSPAARQGTYFGFSPPGDYSPIEAVMVRLRVNPDRLETFDVRDIVDKYSLWIVAGLALLLAATLFVVLRLVHAVRRVRRAGQDRALLLASLGEGVYGLDRSGRCIFINPAALSMLGARSEDALGKDFHSLFHHHQADGQPYPKESCAVHQTMADGCRRELEDWYFARDGRGLPVQSIATPIVRGRSVVGAVVAFQNIAERKRAAADNVRTKERLQLALEASNVSLWDFDIGARTLFLDENWAKMFGYPPGAVVTTIEAVARAVHPDDLAQFRRAAIGTIKGTTANFRADFRVRSAAGAWKWVTTRGRVVARDERGRALRAIGTNVDISERKAVEAALQASEERFREMALMSSDWLWEQDAEFRFTLMSTDLRTRSGLAPTSTLGKMRWELPIVGVSEAQWQAHRALLDRHEPFDDFVYQIRNDAGELRWFSVNGKPIFDADGNFTGYRGIGRDFTERRRADEELRRSEATLAKVFHNSPIPITFSRLRDGLYVDVNEAYTATYGWTRDEVLGRTSLDVGIWQSPAERQRWVEALAAGERTRDFEATMCDRWGGLRTVLLSAERLELDGEACILTLIYDITERKEAEARIHRLAHVDALTELPNRFALMARLEQVCASAQRYARRGALLFMDLDRFKNINDSLGHTVGDGLLIEVARRLEKCMRASDTVARIGGDEFVVLLPEVDDVADVATAARKIVAQFVEPIRLRGHMLHTTPSIGIALCPIDGASPEEILKSADTAMYRAKGLGGNNYQFFTKAMNEAAAERLRIEAELRQALEKGELSIHWQPQVDLRTRTLAGFEVLARWHHPLRGYIPPDKFIPVAEETGLISELGEFVLRLACRQGREMIDGGCAIPRIAVNLSARQAHGADFTERVAAILAETRLPDGVLAFEITESAVMEQPELMVQLLHKLRAMAIHLAVDDFGTGYSSLSYLKLFPIHHLKIDRSFVKDIEFDPNDRAIAISTIALAHSLGLQVVAEGVESPGQVDLLRANGCDEVQGYFYARPMPADQVADWVAAFGRDVAQPST